MFPDKLDGAEVLQYTEKGSYEIIKYTTSEKFGTVCYYAVARYDEYNTFYLFGCNSDFEVISDYECENEQECKSVVRLKGYKVQWHKP